MIRVDYVIALAAAGLAASVAPAQSKKGRITTPPPIISAPFQPERYGDWTVNWIGGGYAAYTTNDDGSLVGVYCTKTGCTGYANMQIKCEDGHKYPVLFNAPSAASTGMLYCKPIGERYLLGFDIDNAITDAFTTGGELGMAVPLASGRFAVSRFSLTGALKASFRAIDLAKPADDTKRRLGDSTY